MRVDRAETSAIHEDARGLVWSLGELPAGLWEEIAGSAAGLRAPEDDPIVE